MEARDPAQPELTLFNPIACTIEENPRARHVRLKVSLYDASLTVVVPRGYDRRKVSEVLEEKRRWIERARREVLASREGNAATAGKLPQAVEIAALGEAWPIRYRPEACRWAVAKELCGQEDQALLVRGNIADPKEVAAALGRWAHRKAKAALIPRFLELSRRVQLPAGEVRVKAMKSCWASCSPRHHISINRNLLFLPPSLVEYIFLHELCHTVHLNHSRRFWALLHSHLPDCKERDKRIRTAWRFVPAWAGGGE